MPACSWPSSRTGGAIVNIGDWATARPYRDHSAYFVSKGAIPTLDADVRRRVGPARTRQRHPPRPRADARRPAQRQSASEASKARCYSRAGRPENIADAVVFLAENDFITGVCLPSRRRPNPRRNQLTIITPSQRQ